MLALLVGAGLLVAALFGADTSGSAVAARLPERIGLDGLGACVLSVALAWGLAARAGGRAVVAAGLMLALAVAALATDLVVLRSGAAVLVGVVGAVLGVMATRPAVTFPRALREVVLALLLATLGGLAALGYRPTVETLRFRYLVLGLSFLLVVVLVHRLGAGFHGLGARGLLVVLVAVVVVTVSLAYTELLRRYGTPEVIGTVHQGVRWSREVLGGFPRPLQAVLGIPAMVWGCHQRARRRQGWWACAFGVAATAPVVHLVVDPSVPVGDAVVTEVMSGVVGMLLAYVVIRADLFLTGPRGARARRAEEAAALRPEPARTAPLL